MKILRNFLILGVSFISVVFLLLVLPLQGCDSPQQYARIRGEHFEIYEHGKWKRFFIKGVNVSLALPGHRPGAFPASIAHYKRYIEMIGKMNANTIRVYTLQPPIFYQTLRNYNLAHPDKPLWLLQGVWLDEEMDKGDDFLTSPVTNDIFKEEIKRVINVLHGSADIGVRPGWAYGVYRADVSRWVIGLLLGREMDPYIVDDTNKHHPQVTHFKGKYFSIKDAEPIEVWAVQMLNYAVSFSQETYQLQYPVGMSNWATLDPLKHPTELPAPQSSEDFATLDLKKTKLTPANTGGMFISYHLYPYYPNFINLDPKYYPHHDHIGHNPYEAYLQALKKYYEGFPLLAAEYGLPSAMGCVHTSSSGMNHGMQDEYKQAKGVVRMTDNIIRSGLAGGAIFAWMDEWFKRTWLLDPRQNGARIARWHNMLSPEENYGFIAMEAYRKGHTVTFGDPSTWTTAPLMARQHSINLPQLPKNSYRKMFVLKAFRVQSDMAYLYMQIEVESLDPDGNGKIDWDKVTYIIGIDTYDSKLGESRLHADLPIQLRSRIEFRIILKGNGKNQPEGQIEVIRPYDLYGIWHGYRKPSQLYRTVRTDSGLFNPLWWVMEAQLDDPQDPKKIIQKQLDFPIGKLHYGHHLPDKKKDYNALSHFYGNIQANIISIRIPWSLLNITDPSRRDVFQDDPSTKKYDSVKTAGFRFVVATVTKNQKAQLQLVDILPGKPASSSEMTIVPPSSLFRWPTWEYPQFRERIRPVYYFMQEKFGSMP